MQTSFFSTQIRYFLEVARTGSVSQAAVHLHVAASAVSRQVAKLEDQLGCALFERKARGMVPTDAGERLMAYVRAGSEDGERVMEQVRGLADHSARRVRVACTEGFATGFMPEVMAGFRRSHPEALIELSVDSPEAVSRLLLQGETDVALKYTVAPEKGVTVQHAATAPMYALMLPTHPLARARAVTAASVVNYPLGISAKGMTGRQLFDMVASIQSLQYQASVVSNFSSALLPSVRSDDIMLSGYLTAAHLIRQGQLVAVPFAEPQLNQRVLQVLSLHGQTLAPLVLAFMGQLIAAIRQSGNGMAPSRRRVAKKSS
ncbi:LysR family transcriptional regulator [Polaromonas aquatica]|uniref:LysR family transcriptional regulator n=1 Tax=Polaromonas aquatica TaxID=332657 RepID=UPI003D648E37